MELSLEEFNAMYRAIKKTKFVITLDNTEFEANVINVDDNEVCSIYTGKCPSKNIKQLEAEIMMKFCQKVVNDYKEYLKEKVVELKA